MIRQLRSLGYRIESLILNPANHKRRDFSSLQPTCLPRRNFSGVPTIQHIASAVSGSMPRHLSLKLAKVISSESGLE